MDSLTGPEQMLQRPVDSGSLLKQSQQAPTLLRDLSSRSSRFPQSLWSKPETPELWASLETLLLTCLTTGDDKSARECLERISKRFGPANERVMGLRGLYEEALAKDDAALENILEGYDSVLKENPVNVVGSFILNPSGSVL